MGAMAWPPVGAGHGERSGQRVGSGHRERDREPAWAASSWRAGLGQDGSVPA